MQLAELIVLTFANGKRTITGQFRRAQRSQINEKFNFAVDFPVFCQARYEEMLLSKNVLYVFVCKTVGVCPVIVGKGLAMSYFVCKIRLGHGDSPERKMMLKCGKEDSRPALCLILS